jgi:hypothetical protein
VTIREIGRDLAPWELQLGWIETTTRRLQLPADIAGDFDFQ